VPIFFQSKADELPGPSTIKFKFIVVVVVTFIHSLTVRGLPQQPACCHDNVSPRCHSLLSDLSSSLGAACPWISPYYPYHNGAAAAAAAAAAAMAAAQLVSQLSLWQIYTDN